MAGTGWAEVCEYCGCREVEPIGELMDEHSALMDAGQLVREELGRGDRMQAMSLLAGLVGNLERHVRREEAGVFAALRDKGEFLEELDALETEHREFRDLIAALDPGTPGFDHAVSGLLDDLGEHVEREDLGIFPVSVVTLGAVGWQIVEQARTDSPSFLLDPAGPVRPTTQRE